MKKRKFRSVNIIIPTYNRAEKLKEGLISLNKINYPKNKYSVLVIDDGSVDNTRQIVKDSKKKLSYKLEYYYQKNKGLSAARNLGIKNAKGEILVFIDDDMEFLKNWLKKLIKPLQDDQIGAVGGPSKAPDKVSLFSRCVDYCMVSSFIGTGGMIGTTKLSVAKYWPRGGNMAVPKKIFDQVGLFDEKFIPSEEIDLDRRIEKAGYELKLVTGAFVWHKPRSSLKGFIRQIFSRGYMKINFWKRYKETFELLYIMPLLGFLGLLSLIVGSLFSSIIKTIFLILILVYFLILIVDSFFAFKKIKSWKVFILVPTLMFLQHYVYGFGSLVALLKIKIEKF